MKLQVSKGRESDQLDVLKTKEMVKDSANLVSSGILFHNHHPLLPWSTLWGADKRPLPQALKVWTGVCETKRSKMVHSRERVHREH